MTSALRDRPPWLALAASPAAWFVYEQGLGTIVRLACTASAVAGVIWGIACVAICIAAGGFGVRAATRPQRDIADRARRFIGLLCVGWAAVMGLAIVYQLLATLIVPQCAR